MFVQCCVKGIQRADDSSASARQPLVAANPDVLLTLPVTGGGISPVRQVKS